ncbi:TetR/AcrR family transcriptional regulator [Spelaeicoccus albus]|uniref:AcrR family transcriptional regulator n=1 Tax=Spelaeicoccus albus TaxID=1280376 RepID=A0A7Z0D578_9MICO|nr:TetR/AcrR family transcriptional regulator [Spelaeicoccus albus]NYI69117.1 AcrR family transcriptional regulator [Spelaeicoccus albus]
MTPEKRTRSNFHSRQKKVGDALRRDTRARLLQAAETEFAAHGYSGTTVTRLAGAAGVSVQTLYLAWGSKRALLRAYVEKLLAGPAASPEDAAGRFVGLSPRERLAELADVVAEVAGRAAIGWTLYRDAAAVDPEIAGDWSELQLLRHRLFTRVVGDIPAAALAKGLTRQGAIDTAWTIASPDSYDLLVHRLGYTLGEFRAWMKQTLGAALLDPDRGSSAS